MTVAANVPACRVCGGVQGNSVYVASERMYGFGDEFEYVRCGTCGCQQIVTVPPDLSKYYPADYYSYAPAPLTGVRRAVTARRDSSYFARGPRGIFGRMVASVLPNPKLAAVARANPAKDARILDVGSGYGGLLMELRGLGFTRLVGIDPYTSATAEGSEGVTIRKMELEDLYGETFDLIMMHHVFEHMPDPMATLRSIARLLEKNGVCIIRIPVAHSWSSKHYGPFWMQHDAPRHLFLHTEASMQNAAAKAGLAVSDVVYDSSEAQFWGSELYQRGISLRSVPIGIYGNPFRRLLSPTFLRYRAAARRLNREKQGDQAAFYLRHAH